MKSKPLPKTVGHHFSDILICKQRAWLHYHGDHKQKLPPPSPLRALMQEGLQIEKNIYDTRYPEGVLIPGILSASPEARAEATKTAMQRGEKAILQGYIQTEQGEGTPDVMELIGPDPTNQIGFSYRLGEIKRSESLKTAHIFQLSWYSELLKNSYNMNQNKGFFILGKNSNQTTNIDLSLYQADYQKTKTDLFHLRDSHLEPGPHLIQYCISCDWRGICMPQLKSQNHLSLIPGISISQTENLKEQNYHTWQDLLSVDDNFLSHLGLGNHEIAICRKGMSNLQNGLPPLRQFLNDEILNQAIVVSITYSQIPQKRKSQQSLKISSIHFENQHNIDSILVHHHNDIPSADLSPLISAKNLIFYSKMDLAVLKSIENNFPFTIKATHVNLVDILSSYVHYPFTSIELENLYEHIANYKNINPLQGANRVKAIREVLNWVRSSI